MSDRAKHFQVELHTLKCKPGEELQQLYNKICRIVSLAYLGPSMEIMNAVGHDAFLEVLGDPSLHMYILDKVPTTMEVALCIALNLQALTGQGMKDSRPWQTAPITLTNQRRKSMSSPA